MSIEIMSNVWKSATQKSGRLLVLLALADNANAHGECWPSVNHIAKKARMSRRQALRVIDELEKGGEISVTHRMGPAGNRSNVYQLAGKYTGVGEPDRMSPPSDKLSPPSDIDVTPLVTYASPPSDIDVTQNHHRIKKETSRERTPTHAGIAAAVGASIHRSQEVTSMMSAISATVKETQTFENEARFEDAATALLRDGYGPDQVRRFGAWWGRPGNGYYAGKPALKSLLDNISSSVSSKAAPGRVTDNERSLKEILGK